MTEYVKGKRDECPIVVVVNGEVRQIAPTEAEKFLQEYDISAKWSKTGELYFSAEPKISQK